MALARAARENAYAPYSDFKVGAAVTARGMTFTGANVENASYGLSMCAERSAVFAAASQGIRRIIAIAVVSGNEQPTWPCGACRQVLLEFGPQVLVVAEGSAGERQLRKLTDLLPDAFGPGDLE